LVKLVQHEGHASGERGQVVVLLGERVIKLLVVKHPLLCELAALDVCFVEHDQQGDLRLVKYGQGVEHVRNEGVWVFASHCVRDVQRVRWESTCERLGDDLARRRLRKGFDLAGSVHNHKAKVQSN
jgi:hypothetical protein